MGTGHDSDINPEAAAAEIDQVAHRVRRRAQWQGWLFLSVAVVDFGFYIAIGSANPTVSRALSPRPSWPGRHGAPWPGRPCPQSQS